MMQLIQVRPIVCVILKAQGLEAKSELFKIVCSAHWQFCAAKFMDIQDLNETESAILPCAVRLGSAFELIGRCYQSLVKYMM